MFQVSLKAARLIPVTKHQFPEFLYACVLRRSGQRRFQCSYEDAFHSGSISTSSAVPINPKTGDPRWNPGGFSSSGVADTSEGRDGRPEGEREPEEQVFLMGEAVLGRSVQRKEERAAIGELTSVSLLGLHLLVWV